MLATNLSLEGLEALRWKMESLPESSLNMEELLAVYAGITERDDITPLWWPQVGPQMMALDSLADETYYGGAAGGGKSDLILGLALTKHKRCLILRRISVYLKALTSRLKLIVGNSEGYHWRGSGYGGTLFTPQGGEIELGGCEHEESKINYMGNPHDLIAFDEVSHFTRTQIQFVSAWNRTTVDNPNQRCRILMCGNPPTSAEGMWIIDDFAPWLADDFEDPAEPGELRWYTMVDEEIKWYRSGDPVEIKGKVRRPRSRTFIPARISDNPILEETGYGEKLNNLEEPLRSQLLYGDHSIRMDDDVWQVIPTSWVRLAFQRYRDWEKRGGVLPPLDRLGVDVARGGDDKTVITRKHGAVIPPLKKYKGLETPNGPKAASKVVLENPGEGSEINVDIIGYGSSCYDFLKVRYEEQVHGINNAAGTKWRDRNKKLRFRNVRAASYWNLREMLDPDNGVGLMIAPDRELLTDLTAPRYEILASGVKIEDKEGIAERIGRSPDCGDSLVLACWHGAKKKFWMA